MYQITLKEMFFVFTACIAVACVVGMYVRSPDALEFLWSLLPPGVRE